MRHQQTGVKTRLGKRKQNLTEIERQYKDALFGKKFRIFTLPFFSLYRKKVGKRKGYRLNISKKYKKDMKKLKNMIKYFK